MEMNDGFFYSYSLHVCDVVRQVMIIRDELFIYTHSSVMCVLHNDRGFSKRSKKLSAQTSIDSMRGNRWALLLYVGVLIKTKLSRGYYKKNYYYLFVSLGCHYQLGCWYIVASLSYKWPFSFRTFETITNNQPCSCIREKWYKGTYMERQVNPWFRFGIGDIERIGIYIFMNIQHWYGRWGFKLD